MRRLVPAVIALLVACGPASSPAPAPTEPAVAIAPAPMVPDDDGPGPSEKPQCERTETTWIGPRRVEIVLPCRPFDPRTDLGYPLP